MKEYFNIPNFMSMNKMLCQPKWRIVIYYTFNYIYVVGGMNKMFCLSMQINLLIKLWLWILLYKTQKCLDYNARMFYISVVIVHFVFVPSNTDHYFRSYINLFYYCIALLYIKSSCISDLIVLVLITIQTLVQKIYRFICCCSILQR